MASVSLQWRPYEQLGRIRWHLLLVVILVLLRLCRVSNLVPRVRAVHLMKACKFVASQG